MAPTVDFTEEFLDILTFCKKDLDLLLVYLLRCFQSVQIPEPVKIARRDEVVQIGHELSAFFSSIRLADITPSSAKDVEKKTISKVREVRDDVGDVIATFKKKCGLTIDRGLLHDIPAIIKDLSLARLHGDYAITLDKIDNLLVVKTFIVKIYESQVRAEPSRDAKVEKELLRIKEKSFLETIRGAEAKNPEYFYKTIELLKRLIGSGKPVCVQVGEDEDGGRDEIRFRTRGENRIQVLYNFNGLGLSAEVMKNPTASTVEYSILGYIEKGVSKVEYGLRAAINVQSLEQKERLMGLDYLWSQYEKAYMAMQRSETARQSSHESLDKQNVDKAINEILFD